MGNAAGCSRINNDASNITGAAGGGVNTMRTTTSALNTIMLNTNIDLNDSDNDFNDNSDNNCNNFNKHEDNMNNNFSQSSLLLQKQTPSISSSLQKQISVIESSKPCTTLSNYQDSDKMHAIFSSTEFEKNQQRQSSGNIATSPTPRTTTAVWLSRRRKAINSTSPTSLSKSDSRTSTAMAPAMTQSNRLLTTTASMTTTTAISTTTGIKKTTVLPTTTALPATTAMPSATVIPSQTVIPTATAIPTTKVIPTAIAASNIFPLSTVVPTSATAISMNAEANMSKTSTETEKTTASIMTTLQDKEEKEQRLWQIKCGVAANAVVLMDYSESTAASPFKRHQSNDESCATFTTINQTPEQPQTSQQPQKKKQQQLLITCATSGNIASKNSNDTDKSIMTTMPNCDVIELNDTTISNKNGDSKNIRKNNSKSTTTNKCNEALLVRKYTYTNQVGNIRDNQQYRRNCSLFSSTASITTKNSNCSLAISTVATANKSSTSQHCVPPVFTTKGNASLLGCVRKTQEVIDITLLDDSSDNDDDSDDDNDDSFGDHNVSCRCSLCLGDQYRQISLDNIYYTTKNQSKITFTSSGPITSIRKITSEIPHTQNIQRRIGGGNYKLVDVGDGNKETTNAICATTSSSTQLKKNGTIGHDDMDNNDDEDLPSSTSEHSILTEAAATLTAVAASRARYNKTKQARSSKTLMQASQLNRNDDNIVAFECSDNATIEIENNNKNNKRRRNLFPGSANGATTTNHYHKKKLGTNKSPYPSPLSHKKVLKRKISRNGRVNTYASDSCNDSNTSDDDESYSSDNSSESVLSSSDVNKKKQYVLLRSKKMKTGLHPSHGSLASLTSSFYSDVDMDRNYDESNTNGKCSIDYLGRHIQFMRAQSASCLKTKRCPKNDGINTDKIKSTAITTTTIVDLKDQKKMSKLNTKKSSRQQKSPLVTKRKNKKTKGRSPGPNVKSPLAKPTKSKQILSPERRRERKSNLFHNGLFTEQKQTDFITRSQDNISKHENIFIEVDKDNICTKIKKWSSEAETQFSGTSSTDTSSSANVTARPAVELLLEYAENVYIDPIYTTPRTVGASTSRHQSCKNGSSSLSLSPSRISASYTEAEFQRMLKSAEKDVGCTLDEIESGSSVRRANSKVSVQDSSNQFKAQYGRILFRTTEYLFKKVWKLHPDDVFVDFGHGVGNAPLQAAYTYGCESRGIEVVADRNIIAEALQTSFENLRDVHRNFHGRFARVGNISFRLGRLEDPANRDFLTRPGPCYDYDSVIHDTDCNNSSAVYRGAIKAMVNNFNGVFAERSAKPGQNVYLDHYVSALFAMMVPGSIMVTFHPLVLPPPRSVVDENRFRQGLSTGDINASFYDYEEIVLGEARKHVSWAGSSCKTDIVVYKYTRLKQQSMTAVFLCSNSNCPKAIASIPNNATRSFVNNDGEDGIVIDCCCHECNVTQKNLRQKSRCVYYGLQM